MAGSLIKIAETTVSSSTASVTLTGIDSTYDVYKLIATNVVPVDTNKFLFLRFTESGTPNTTSNYDRANKSLTAGASFGNNSGNNEDKTELTWQQSNTSTQSSQNICYIFNANNSSEYTFLTLENVGYETSVGQYLGRAGGAVFTVTSTVDGVNLFFDSSNIASGNFKLYGLVK
jgi:hypothetical protein